MATLESESRLTAKPTDVSGRKMDRKIGRSHRRLVVISTIGAAVLGLAAFAWAVRPPASGEYTIAFDKIQTAAVTSGMFENSVSSMGVVAPEETVFLDAEDGGRVEEVLATGGDRVKAGQVLVRLANTQLQLDVLARETEVSSQVNALQQKELDLIRSRLQNESGVESLSTQRDAMQRQVARSERLEREGALAKSQLEDERGQLALLERTLALAKEAKDAEEKIGQSQLEQMKLATSRMQRNLQVARASLDALSLKAPVSGILTSFEPRIGESLSRGARIGQIDSADGNKLSVAIDEYYLENFKVGLTATAKIGNEVCALRVSRVSSQVESGLFKADLGFLKPPQQQVRRGQSVPVVISLSAASQAVIVPNGAFVGSSGGLSAFVVSADGMSAERRAIKLGRRNAASIEVLEGLKPGETLVVSDYAAFQDAHTLRFTH